MFDFSAEEVVLQLSLPVSPLSSRGLVCVSRQRVHFTANSTASSHCLSSFPSSLPTSTLLSVSAFTSVRVCFFLSRSKVSYPAHSLRCSTSHSLSLGSLKVGGPMHLSSTHSPGFDAWCRPQESESAQSAKK